jgi:PAS domain-containing protein
MTKRRKIAVAYALAIPILFVVLILEVGAVYRLNAHEHEIRNRAATLNACDDLIFALEDAQTAAQSYVASGDWNDRAAYTDAAGRVSSSLEALNQLARNDAALESEMQGLNGLATKRLALQHAMDSKKASGIGAPGSPDSAEFSVAEEADEALAKIRADEQTRSQMELASAAQSASSANTIIKYGGVIMIWAAGVAALLLFYDDAGRFRESVERRLHTDILESLPLGLCLTTASGSVLYANPAAEKAFGYKPGELVARNIAALHEENDNDAERGILETLARLTPRGLWSGKLPIRTREDEIVLVPSWIKAMHVGDKDCRLLVHSAPAASGLEQPGDLIANFRALQSPEEDSGTAGRLRATAQIERERTTSPDSETTVASHHAK